MEFDNFELTQDDLSYLERLELEITKKNDDIVAHIGCEDVDMAFPYISDISSDSDSAGDCLQPVRNRKRRRILSETESEDEIIQPSPRGSTSSSGNWYSPSGNQPKIIPFTETPVPGYTCKLQVYAGKHCDTTNTTPTQVVMSLCRHLFQKGHVLYTDNWYTSIDLAEKLLEEEMHLVGTLRKNRKKLPKDVMNAKLKAREYSAAENDKGITVMKWRDKREVSLLSTKHTAKFFTTTNKRGQSKKPQIVVDHNKAKSAVDLSDQMTAYSSPLRKSVKWYRKLACELLLNTAMVNAMVLYKQTTKKNLSVVQFRKAIVSYLVKADEENEINIAKNKTKKVATFCSDCPSQPHYCLTCFNREHRY
ncbi:unnamed protein product [Euphydryas editha]|uniref:PiggyBac transposable element-derived protein domain-containing protein n=1 Tax=Euphydryas editha TaxID=104508 RepID=A0AAU9TLI1_EUPED|nr:unnamed protein product [Euphydryas editha]